MLGVERDLYIEGGGMHLSGKVDNGLKLLYRVVAYV
jgi:hypothetical protein